MKLLSRFLRDFSPSKEAIKEYDGFISYRHDPRQAAIVRSFHQALHRFAKPWHRLRNLRIYRDESNLSAQPNIWKNIEVAIDGAKYFLLIASPESAASAWVQREITYWLKTKDPLKVLIVLTGGKLSWSNVSHSFDAAETTALPACAMSAFSEEPLWVDLSWIEEVDQGREFSEPRFRDAVASVAATLHGVDKDTLSGEDIRQRRRVLFLAYLSLAALGTLLLISTVTAFKFLEERRTAEHQRDVALRQESRALSKISEGMVEKGDPQAAMLVALEGLPQPDGFGGNRPYSPEAAAALFTALNENKQLAQVQLNGPVAASEFLADHNQLIVVEKSGTISIWNTTATESPIWRNEALSGGVTDAEFRVDPLRLAISSSDGTTLFWKMSGDHLEQIASMRNDEAVDQVKIAGEGNDILVETHKDDLESPFNLYLWHVDGNKASRRLLARSESPIPLYVSRTGRHFAFGMGNDDRQQLIVGEISNGVVNVVGRRAVSIGTITTATFSKNDRRLFVAQAGEPSSVYKVDRTLTNLDQFDVHERGIVISAAFDDRCDCLVTGGKDGRIFVRLHEDGKYTSTKLYDFLDDSTITAISFSETGQQRLLVTSNNGIALLLVDKDLIVPDYANPLKINGISSIDAGRMSTDGQSFITQSSNGVVRVWSTSDTVIARQTLERKGKHASDISTRRFWLSSGGKYILGEGISDPNRLFLWKTSTGKLTSIIPDPSSRQGNGTPLSIETALRDETTVISLEYYNNGENKQIVEIVELSPGKEPVIFALPGNNQTGSAMKSLSRDGRKLVTSSSPGFYSKNHGQNLHVWDLTRPAEPPRSIPVQMSATNLFVISPDGSKVFSSQEGTDGGACIWALDGGDMKCDRIDYSVDQIQCAAFSGDHRYLAIGTTQGEVLLYDILLTPKIIKKARIPGEDGVTSLDFDQADSFLVAGNTSEETNDYDNFYVWRFTKDDSQPLQLFGSRSDITIGKDVLVTGSNHDRYLLWDMTTDPPISARLPDTQAELMLGFLEDERTILFGYPPDPSSNHPIEVRRVAVPDFKGALAQAARQTLVRCLTASERTSLGLDVERNSTGADGILHTGSGDLGPRCSPRERESRLQVEGRTQSELTASELPM